MEKQPYQYWRSQAGDHKTIRRRRTGQASTTRERLIPGAEYIFDGVQLVLKSKPKEDFIIQPGKFYRTRSGEKAHITVINRDKEGNLDSLEPVLGIVDFNGLGKWKNLIWSIEGEARRPYGRSHDIVAEWSEG